jgi:hypothetical protein
MKDENIKIAETPEEELEMLKKTGLVDGGHHLKKCTNCGECEDIALETINMMIDMFNLVVKEKGTKAGLILAAYMFTQGLKDSYGITMHNSAMADKKDKFFEMSVKAWNDDLKDDNVPFKIEYLKE